MFDIATVFSGPTMSLWGLFLKHLIDVAEANDQAAPVWSSTTISDWPGVDSIPGIGLTLDAGWSAALRQDFVGLEEDAGRAMLCDAAVPGGRFPEPTARRPASLPQPKTVLLF